MTNRPTTDDADHQDDRTSEYLWRPDAEPEPEIARLERTLAPARYRGTAPPWPVRTWTAPARLVAIAAMLAVVAGVATFVVRRPASSPLPPSGWGVERLAGSATVGARPLVERDRLGVGEWLETGSTARVEVAVADIGAVTVHPNSRVRLLTTDPDREHRLQLARGRIDAFIVAPPRLFFVDTPAAVAVDLGCAYTLVVDEGGDGALEVTLGWVMLETDGRHAIVPTGARCPIRAGRGPGTPYFDDAPPSLREALARLETAGADDGAALEAILAASRPRDRLSLWHLIERVTPADRERVVDAMLAFEPLPPDVTRDAVLTLDRAALDAWWRDLEPAW